MEDISNMITDQFYDDFKKGQVLGFTKDGVVHHFKITRLDKKRKIVKIDPIKLYTEKELNDKFNQDAINKIKEGETVE